MDNPFITTRVAAERYLHTSMDMVERLCIRGVFKTARKPSGSRRGHWQIARAEVVQHLARTLLREN